MYEKCSAVFGCLGLRIGAWRMRSTEFGVFEIKCRSMFYQEDCFWSVRWRKVGHIVLKLLCLNHLAARMGCIISKPLCLEHTVARVVYIVSKPMYLECMLSRDGLHCIGTDDFGAFGGEGWVCIALKPMHLECLASRDGLHCIGTDAFGIFEGTFTSHRNRCAWCV